MHILSKGLFSSPRRLLSYQKTTISLPSHSIRFVYKNVVHVELRSCSRVLFDSLFLIDLFHWNCFVILHDVIELQSAIVIRKSWTRQFIMTDWISSKWNRKRKEFLLKNSSFRLTNDSSFFSSVEKEKR